MKYKLLGKSGLRVSELCLGTMTFGTDWGWGASKEECKKIFDKFTDEGGNFIDTANNYTDGSSEKIVGELIKGDRDRYIVATKYTLSENPDFLNYGGNHRKNMMRSVKASLERLQTDIDVLYLHMWDYTTPIEEIMRAFDDLIKMGKIHYIAFSDTPSWIVSRANAIAESKGWSPAVAIQLPYNIMERDPERNSLPMAKMLDLAVCPWGLLGGGLLSGKYSRNSDENKGTKNSNSRLTEGIWGPPHEMALKLAKFVDKIADEIGCTSSQVAISWVQQQSSNIIPILGVRNLEQIEDNLGSLNVHLSKEHVEKLGKVTGFKLGFPEDFLAGDHVKSIIFGKKYRDLLNHRKAEPN